MVFSNFLEFTVRSDSSSGSDDVLQVKQPAKKKAKQGKKAKAAKQAHFEGWFSTSQLESFVSRHGLLTDWPLIPVIQIVHVCTRKQRDFYKKGSLKRKKITRSTCMYLLLRTFGV